MKKSIFTESYIAKQYTDVFEPCLQEIADYNFDMFYKDYREYTDKAKGFYKLLEVELPKFKSSFEVMSEYVNSAGSKYKDLAKSDFLFMENCSAQQTYANQLAALKYPYEIYCKYEYQRFRSLFVETEKTVENIVCTSGLNLVLDVKKCNISDECINEILKYSDKYGAEQWRQVASKDMVFTYPYINAIVIFDILNSHKYDIALYDSSLYYFCVIAQSVHMDVLDTLKMSKESELDLFEAEITAQMERMGNDSLVTFSKSIAIFKSNVEHMVLNKTRGVAEELNKKIDEFYNKLARKKNIIYGIVLLSLLIALGAVAFITLNVLGLLEEFDFGNIIRLLLFIVLICTILMLPYTIAKAVISKKRNKERTQEKKLNEDSASTWYSFVKEAAYTTGGRMITQRIHAKVNDELTEVVEKFDGLSDKIDELTDYKDNLDKAIKETTAYLPENIANNIRLLDKTYSQMSSGTAKDYQSAVFQAQQVIKQEDEETQRRMKEAERERQEQEHRRRVMESQRRVEQYAKEQVEQARRQAEAAEAQAAAAKAQAAAAEAQAEYARQTRDAERESAEQNKKIAEESKRQTELQKQQMDRWEQERVRQEFERSRNK